jgi:uncharacterized damage-inducible protein DinB
VETIRNMFEHLFWANQRILEILKNMEGENEKVNNLFSHILLAERVWFMRLTGLDSTKLPIWAEDDLAACTDLVTQNNENYSEFLSGIPNSDLEQVVSYRNSLGKEFTNTVRDILTHVALHGQYHRGQINLLLRSNEIEPVNVDFITFRR